MDETQRAQIGRLQLLLRNPLFFSLKRQDFQNGGGHRRILPLTIDESRDEK
jgi:hypothetical protein